MTGAKRKRAPRTHDAAIAALRAKALDLWKLGSDPAVWDSYASCRMRSSCLTYAAEYLSSIAGAVERTSGKARRGRAK